jgi:amino acid transporter
MVSYKIKGKRGTRHHAICWFSHHSLFFFFFFLFSFFFFLFSFFFFLFSFFFFIFYFFLLKKKKKKKKKKNLPHNGFLGLIHVVCHSAFLPGALRLQQPQPMMLNVQDKESTSFPDTTMPVE